MEIYICDDETQILQDLALEAKQHCPDSRICLFTNGKDLQAMLQQDICDVLLLDIDMPELTGLEVAAGISALPHPPLLVFVTSHDELVYDSFQYHPFGFIRKSYFKEEIGKVLSDCKREITGRQRHFCFRAEGREVRLLLSDILYFEAEGNYLKLHTRNETYRFRSTVAAVENTLTGSGWIRIHKGFLVNQEAVQMLGGEETVLTEGTRLPIGKSYGEAAKRQLMEYMRR